MAQLVKTVQGLAVASVKTVQGVAMSAVKTIQGVDNTSGGGGPPAFVEVGSDNVASATSTPINITFAAGNFGVVTYRIGDVGRTVTVSDNINGAWTEAISAELAGHGEVGIFFIPNTGGAATTVTLSLTGGATTIRWSVLEYSGVSASSPLDQTSSASGASGNMDPGSVTTTTASQLLISTCGLNVAIDVVPGTNYTLEAAVPANPNARQATQDRVVSSTGTFSGAFDNAGNSGSWISCMASFKGA